MFKKSTFLALLGVVIGVLLGLGVLAGQNYLGKFVIDFLNDEVKTALPNCRLETDKYHVSFLRLNAYVNNPRIVCEKEVNESKNANNDSEKEEKALYFRQIRVKVSPSEILNKTVVLKQLILDTGYSKGVLPKSPTYEFIDYLIRPSDDPNHKPPFIKVSLKELLVKNTSFDERVSDSVKLKGTGLSLRVFQNDKKDFSIVGGVEDAYISHKNSVSRISTKYDFGSVLVDVLSKNNTPDINLQNIIVNGPGVKLNGGFDILGDNTISNGKYKAKFDSRFLDKSYSKIFTYNLKTNGVVRGDIDNIIIDGSINENISNNNKDTSADKENKIKDKKILNKLFFSNTPFIFDKFFANLLVDINSKNTSVRLKNISLSGKDIHITSLEDFVLDNDNFNTKLKFDINTLDYSFVKLNDINGVLSLIGNTSDYKIKLETSINSIDGLAFQTPKIDLSLVYHNDILTFDVSSKDYIQGSGVIDLDKNGQIYLENFDIGINKLPLKNTADESNWLLSSDISFNGLLSLYTLKGLGRLALSSDNFNGESTLSGRVSLEDGLISVNLTNPLKSFETNLNLNLKDELPSKLTLKLKDFNPNQYAPNAKCLVLNLDGEYNFNIVNIKKGNGLLNINDIKLGCEPYNLKLLAPVSSKITDGVLNINPIVLKGNDANNNIKISGIVDTEDRIDVNVDGNFKVSTFSDFMPFADELSGEVMANINVKDKVSSPRIFGNAKIIDGSLFLESSNVSVRKLNGEFVLKGMQVEIKEALAKVNSGFLKVDGNIDLLDFSKSIANANFKKIDLQIDDNTNLAISGDLNLTKGRFFPRLSGTINIDNLEFVKKITLDALLNFLKNQIFFYEKNINVNTKSQDDLKLELNVAIKSDDSMNVKMDFIDAILNCDLLIQGFSKFPLISGTVQASEGSFGLRNKRFLINHANVNFEKHQSPTLDITGESYLRNASGENSLIIVDIQGNLQAPLVTLMSDSGLSQKEIFNLLASGEDYQGEATTSSESEAFLNDVSSFLTSPSIDGFKNILNSATNIDNLSVTSKYNPNTGTTEPAIIAEKKITDEITVIGESFVGSASGSTKLSMSYYLSPKSYINTYFESLSSTQDAGMDLNYNVLSSSNTLTSYSFKGNSSYSEMQLRNLLYINERKVISKQKVKEKRRDLKRFYLKNGFLDVRVKTRITTDDSLVKKVIFEIQENERYKIKKIKIKSDKFSKKLFSEVSHFIGKAFTEKNNKNIQKHIRDYLKNKGYISSRITSELEVLGNNNIGLSLEIDLLQKYEFKFKGNTKFSKDDFLKTIKFKEREYPFGSNVILLLVEGIDKLYRDNGYLFASIASDVEKTSDGLKYTININEENICKVKSVSVSGNKQISFEKLHLKLRDKGKTFYDGFIKPKFAVEEDIVENEKVIKDIYRELGYIKVKVSHKLNISDSGEFTDIEYIIDEGNKFYISDVKVVGLPKELEGKMTYSQNITLPKKIKLVKNIESKLDNLGYINHKIKETLDKKNNSLLIEVFPNEKIQINNIKVIGNAKVDEYTVIKNLKIKAGDLYQNKKIEQSKNTLLKLGLFSRISFTLKDVEGSSDKKDLVIEVEEKAFNTLDVGIGYSSEYGVHLLSRAVNKSVFKDGKTISLGSDLFFDDMSGSVNQGSADLRFIDPSVLGTDIGFSKDFRYQKLTTNTNEYDLDRYIDSTTLFFPLSDKLTFNIGQNFSIESLSDVSKDAIIGKYDNGRYNLSYLISSLRYDARDNVLNPKSGYALNLEYKLANKIMFSDAEFHSITLHTNAIYPFYDDFNFSFNNFVGASKAYGDTNEVPITQRFYLGGANTMRGYKENELGPRGENGSVIGGDFIFYNNFELNYFILESLSVHTFLDVGNVFLRDDSISLDDLKYSAGVGFRFNLPIGPIGFDLAIPVNPKSYEDSYRVHFSIGAKF